MAFPVLLAAILSGFGFFVWLRPRPQRAPLPPGPPADPLIGHIRIIPSVGLEFKLFEWSQIYGDVMQLRIPGGSIIALNSHEAAVDLLDKRGHNYSDRQRFVLAELSGWGSTSLLMMRDGKQLRLHRKIFQYFSQKQCESFRDVLMRESRRLLFHLRKDPKEFDAHLKRFATNVIIDIGYGHTATLDDDKYTQMGNAIVHAMTTIGPPGNTIVDFVPILRYFPTWFPGTYYATMSRAIRPLIENMREYPFNECQKQMAQGIAKPSFMAHLLEKLHQEGDQCEYTDHDIQGAGVMMYAAGADTTASTLAIFMLAMVLHPECQKKAQEELDTIVGPGKLPEFGDRSSLPYLNNLILECYRWNPVAPLGIPHTSVKDDVYRGMFIPKGSIVIANTRGIFWNEDTYANAREFNPDRYFPDPIGRNEPVPTAQYGYGRRICPGRHLADQSVFFAIASVLAAFTIEKAIDKHGNEITPEIAFDSGLANHPKEYKCIIRPRNASSQRMLDEIVEF